MKKLILPAVLIMLLASACSPTPQPVEFGADACAHCKMTIVEVPFAAELVSSKGKVFKFDAIECMADYLKDHAETEFAFQLVRDFNQPDDWQDAKTCSYLISDEVPSPMGAYLSAYATEAQAIQMREAKGGQVFDWENLLIYLK